MTNNLFYNLLSVLMVLRDTYITSMLRGAVFLLLLLHFACQQTPSTPPSDPAVEAARAAEQEKSVEGKQMLVTEQIGILRTEVRKVLEDMHGVFRDAESMRANASKEKGAAVNDSVDAVFEKSASVLGAIFILQGSVDAVEQRLKENVLDEENAQKMVDKLRLDVKSYQTDVKNFQDMLNAGKSAKAEKK